MVSCSVRVTRVVWAEQRKTNEMKKWKHRPALLISPFHLRHLSFPLSSSCNFSSLPISSSSISLTNVGRLQTQSRFSPNLVERSLSLITLPLSSISLSRRLSRWNSANVISFSDHRSLRDVSLAAAVSAGHRLPRYSLPKVISLSAALQLSKPLPRQLFHIKQSKKTTLMKV